ncbi:class I SAM-dependent methyltransferase [Belnapia sp. F-4-1]|uniref:class I SAM-dependent methyltransferase n=1 Tax=Belnapia sp. F-4-1 TaxID=1545443 RepID=UPI00068D6A03|nr:class I SAM-dependent methyltransferase [Belnapia sp. F-4-1]
MNAIPDGLHPAMTAAEQALLAAAVADRCCGLEFGCGGSTGLLLAAGLPRLLSVDSDRAWLERVAAANAPAIAAGRLRLLHVDIGPTGPWGYPAEAASLPRWPAYWRDPWEAAGEVDAVLVDGRFRVACALAGLPRLAPGALVIVHDFWSRAAYRAPLLRHFSLDGSAGTLALLRPKPGLDPATLAVDIAAHAFEPG